MYVFNGLFFSIKTNIIDEFSYLFLLTFINIHILTEPVLFSILCLQSSIGFSNDKIVQQSQK